MQAHFNNLTASGITYLSDPLTPTPPCYLYWRDPNGHQNFWSPVTGQASGSSLSPRTEYRETEADTSAPFNWRPADFLSSRLEGIAVIKKMPSSEKVIFAQVHAKDAPSPFVKLFRAGQELRAEVRFRPGDSSSPVVIRLPLAFDVAQATYSIEVTGDGQLIILFNGERFECPIDPNWDQYPFYFKAGSYCIDSDGPETEGGWVVYEKLAVFHELG